MIGFEDERELTGRVKDFKKLGFSRAKNKKVLKKLRLG